MKSTIIDKVRRKVNKFSIDETVPFSDIIIKGVPKDIIRQYLHRLHDDGLITINSTGHFKRETPYNKYIFVYGSLKKGFINHHILKKYALRIGKAKTIKKFGMYKESGGNYPYLIASQEHYINGELYLIKRKELMDKLDQFEGAPDYYERQTAMIKYYRNKTEIKKAFIYVQSGVSAPRGQKALSEWNEDEHNDIWVKDYLQRLKEKHNA